MKFAVILIIIMLIGILSKLEKIIRLIKNMDSKNKKKEFPSLKELIGKNIKIKISEDADFVFGFEAEGILKEFDDIWIVVECINKKEEYYYRIKDILYIDTY